MISGKDLKKIGFVEGKALGLALEFVEKEDDALNMDEMLALLKQTLENPSSYINDIRVSSIALELLKPADDTIALNIESKSYQIYGADAIEEGAMKPNGNCDEITSRCRWRANARRSSRIRSAYWRRVGYEKFSYSFWCRC
jgi:hypothetical protein